MNKLKRYYPFFINDLKSNMAYKGSFYLFMVCRIIEAFISYYLWMAIYNSSSNGVLGGLSKDEMVVYIFMTNITINVVGIGLSYHINKDVTEGAVAINLIKPIDYRMSLISRAAGTAVYKLLIPGVFVWAGVEIYKCNVLNLKVTSISNMLLYLISMILSFMIYVLFDFCFGMLAFTNTYMFGMNIVKHTVLTFLSGELIPISFFPAAVGKIFELLPFSSMLYTPVMIYLGKYSVNEIIKAFALQIVWILLLYGLGSFLWKKITKRLIVLGG